jgi:hypothetical protein
VNSNQAPKRVNNADGATPYIVRYMVETPAGWLGAYDFEAFAEYLNMSERAESGSAPVAGFSGRLQDGTAGENPASPTKEAP